MGIPFRVDGLSPSLGCRTMANPARAAFTYRLGGRPLRVNGFAPIGGRGQSTKCGVRGSRICRRSAKVRVSGWVHHRRSKAPLSRDSDGSGFLQAVFFAPSCRPRCSGGGTYRAGVSWRSRVWCAPTAIARESNSESRLEKLADAQIFPSPQGTWRRVSARSPASLAALARNAINGSERVLEVVPGLF